MQVKLVSALENKEQLIRFRVYEKSATSAQADGSKEQRKDRYTLVKLYNNKYMIASPEITNTEVFGIHRYSSF